MLRSSISRRGISVDLDTSPPRPRHLQLAALFQLPGCRHPDHHFCLKRPTASLPARPRSCPRASRSDWSRRSIPISTTRGSGWWSRWTRRVSRISSRIASSGSSGRKCRPPASRDWKPSSPAVISPSRSVHNQIVPEIHRSQYGPAGAPGSPRGCIISLHADTLGSIQIGTGVYYRNIEIGSVQGYNLQDDDSVLIDPSSSNKNTPTLSGNRAGSATPAAYPSPASSPT